MAKKNKKQNKAIVQEQAKQLEAQNNVEVLRENPEDTTPPKKKKGKKNKK